MFGKSYGSIAYAGSRLRGAGKITTIFRSGRAKWVRVSAAQAFIPAREAIVAALGTGPKTVPALAQETGKGISTVKSALHRHLLSDGTVTRSQFEIYALAGAEPPYVSKSDAIVAALQKNGPMSFRELVREISITPRSLPQFLEVLRAKHKIIRTARGIYALPGTAPPFVPTSDAIVTALTKRRMKLGALIEKVQKLANAKRARGTIRTVLARLQKEGIVTQDRQWGEYRLARVPLAAVRNTRNSVHRQRNAPRTRTSTVQ